jgi:beta-mannosidase
LLRGLIDRDLHGVRLVVSDDHEGIKSSVAGELPGAEWQRCAVHFRRRKPHCSGTLFWQLNDCWPVLSWSVLDYYGFGKAGYYYVRRAYAPMLASFKAIPEGGVELWITNDTLSEVEDEVVVRLATFAGEVIWEKDFHIRVAANDSRPVRRWPRDRVQGRPDLYLSVRSAGQLFAPNRHFFETSKISTLPLRISNSS